MTDLRLLLERGLAVGIGFIVLFLCERYVS